MRFAAVRERAEREGWVATVLETVRKLRRAALGAA
jgi:hypothetical protein